MPKTGDTFGPIPQSVRLDGSGNGTIMFQAVGGAKRITNLFGNVSTSTAQATCSLYVGTISVATRVYLSNSGSTGFTARGQIDLTDGQILYVVWSGGDAAATAYATFTGYSLNFNDVGASSIESEDPVAAGDGTLIFPAIKSVNYVPDVSGWNLDRDGNAELNTAVIRGSLSAAGGSILADDSGFWVLNSDDITDSSYIHLYSFLGNEYIALRPAIGSSTADLSEGAFYSTWAPDGDEGYPTISMQSPAVVGVSDTASVDLTGGLTDGTVGSDITFTATRQINRICPTGDFDGDYQIDSGRGLVIMDARISDSGTVTTTETVVSTLASTTYKAGRAYMALAFGSVRQSLSTSRTLIRCRKTNVAGQMVSTTPRGVAHTSASASFNVYCPFIFYVTGSDVTAALCVTILGQASSNTIYEAQSGLAVYDIGAEAMVNGWATQLT